MLQGDIRAKSAGKRDQRLVVGGGLEEECSGGGRAAPGPVDRGAGLLADGEVPELLTQREKL